jgi:hypothetical protein
LQRAWCASEIFAECIQECVENQQNDCKDNMETQALVKERIMGLSAMLLGFKPFIGFLSSFIVPKHSSRYVKRPL